MGPTYLYFSKMLRRIYVACDTCILMAFSNVETQKLRLIIWQVAFLQKGHLYLLLGYPQVSQTYGVPI